MIDQNSMLYWWPLVEDLDIPMPKTEILELGMSIDEIYGLMEGNEDSANAMDKNIPKIEAAIDRMGTPAFLRTGHTSGKHEWEKTCYYDAGNPLKYHISELLEHSSLCDLTVDAIVVREYIPMQTGFTAFFGEMPVNPERRYFVRDGAVECHHPYWIPEAIAEGTFVDLPENWLELLVGMNTESSEEVELLTKYAEQIGCAMEEERNYWSVDFCKAADDRWIFIDMATGNRSWHPTCPFAQAINVRSRSKYRLS